MEETAKVHPIACEACRNKKSKCSRHLPTCSQCTLSGATCRYPQINKRGVPSGYISQIEQRLFHTETVLFELLSSSDGFIATSNQCHLSDYQRKLLADYEQRQSKSAKIEEWKRFPLQSSEDRRQWWESRRSILADIANHQVESLMQGSPIPAQDLEAMTPISTNSEDQVPVGFAASSMPSSQLLQSPRPLWQSTASNGSMSGVRFTTMREDPDVDILEEFTATNLARPPRDNQEGKAQAQTQDLDCLEEKGMAWRKYF